MVVKVGPVKSSSLFSRSVVMGENPSNHVFVDLDVERQGDVFTLLQFDYRMNKFCGRALRAGLPKAIR